MKNGVKLWMITLAVMLFSSCYDRDIIDSKEFGFSLPDVKNLNYTRQDNKVGLTWQIPTDDISPNFKRPVEVSIQIIENNVYKNIITVSENTPSVDFTININNKYRYVVKLLGYLTDEAKEEGKTDRVYSKGQVIEIQ